MTDTTTELPTVAVRPDGMPDTYWHDIEEGMREPLDSVTRRLAQRNLDNWNTMLDTARQRDTLIANHNDRIESLAGQANKAARNLEIVAEELLSEAESRGWCSEYDQFVEKVNDRCGAEVLKPCARAYSVTFTVSVQVNARGEDAAEEEANSELESALARAGFNDYSYDHENTEYADS